ncbi:molybdate ABC transporter permease subunit [Xenophilus arseniciresistens]|uniref:Molybdenum transport system permease n=1 Tax=Xenophilus arseniciresistens TaxID=1283306 RepID=A0AAE3N918_9BURK|nr:molybdate ABC transporter permease subunit [Xenophilus arseniciresistens]MDA7417183.1 molybdate ABC transporter permease subunit [Xenophilus arseniciresistens]
MLSPLWLTLKVALLATALAGMLGIGLGWWMARRRFAGHAVLDAALLLPMVLPPTVVGYYLIVLVGRQGPLGRWLESSFGITLLFTWQGAVLASAVVALPLIYKAARAAFEDTDIRLAQAARTLGAREWEVFFRISLPLALRGIGAGLALTFARAMGEFGATLMIAGNLPGRTQTLSVAVYSAVQAGDDPLALRLTLLISAVCIVLLVIASRLLQARH